MTNNEFKAWFEGFCEGLEGAPTKRQWDRIQAQVKKINDVPLFPIIQERVVYQDRYLPAPMLPYIQTWCSAQRAQSIQSSRHDVPMNAASVVDTAAELRRIGQQDFMGVASS